jgi:hypothetical protein
MESWRIISCIFRWSKLDCISPEPISICRERNGGAGAGNTCGGGLGSGRIELLAAQEQAGQMICLNSGKSGTSAKK